LCLLEAGFESSKRECGDFLNINWLRHGEIGYQKWNGAGSGTRSRPGATTVTNLTDGKNDGIASVALAFQHRNEVEERRFSVTSHFGYPFGGIPHNRLRSAA
jgi:hypothetical protein